MKYNKCMSKLYEKQLEKEYVYEGRVITVRKDKAELPDGSIALREVVEHPGGVCIALEDDDGTFFFVSQWRYAQEKVVLEYPAGKREEGEDPLETAKREIIEETGYEGKDFEYYGEFIPTGAYCAEKIYMYYAKKGTYYGQHLDKDENIRVTKMTLDEVVEKIMKHEITDGKTIALTFMIRERKKHERD